MRKKSTLLLHSPETCNGGLISKHVMYFTPMDGDGGWGEVGWCGGVIAGRRRSVYRLPSQQVPSSPLPPPTCTFFLNPSDQDPPPPQKKREKLASPHLPTH